jgi:CDP-glucose 4,6-dehydratase
MDNPLPEAQALAIDSSLARNQLNWLPAWDTDRVVRETASWYRDYYANPKDVLNITLAQINAWRSALNSY